MLQIFMMKHTHKDKLVVTEKFAYYELSAKGKAYIKEETAFCSRIPR